MKTQKIIFGFTVILIVLLSSCSGSETSTIQSTQIVYQEWMIKNLVITKFRNGDKIPIINDEKEWNEYGAQGKPACCYYNNDPKNKEIYGMLYNWSAVNDPRGLAPLNWRIPSKQDWINLINSVGRHPNAGIKMKSSSGWKDYKIKSHEPSGTNESGFNGLPGGFRLGNGQWREIETNGYWWGYDGNSPIACRLSCSEDGAFIREQGGRYGLSVRCIKEVTVNADQQGTNEQDVKFINFQNNLSNGRWRCIAIESGITPFLKGSALTFRKGDMFVDKEGVETINKYSLTGTDNTVNGGTLNIVDININGKSEKLFWINDDQIDISWGGSKAKMKLQREKDAVLPNPNVASGTFIDPRDGTEYPYRLIGQQIWMTKNLLYLPQVLENKKGEIGPNYYVENDEGFTQYDSGTEINRFKSNKYFQKYGVAYTWLAAIDACPSGWHLPSQEEWEVVIKQWGDLGGKHLKSTNGWDTGNGDNASGLNIYPTQVHDAWAWFWSSTEAGSYTSEDLPKYYAMGANTVSDGLIPTARDIKSTAIAVRCLKN